MARERRMISQTDLLRLRNKLRQLPAIMIKRNWKSVLLNLQALQFFILAQLLRLNLRRRRIELRMRFNATRAAVEGRYCSRWRSCISVLLRLLRKWRRQWGWADRYQYYCKSWKSRLEWFANAGEEGSVVIQKGRKGWFWLQCSDRPIWKLVCRRSYWPNQLQRVALQNAASVAGMFLSTECVIADKKEENPAQCLQLAAAEWAAWWVSPKQCYVKKPGDFLRGFFTSNISQRSGSGCPQAEGLRLQGPRDAEISR